MTHIKRVTLTVAAVALLSTAYAAGRHAAYAQTQLEINESTYKDFLKTDGQLNLVYKKLLKKYDPKDPTDSITRKKIILAERNWVSYRDAESDAEASWQAEGGSMYPTCFNLAAKQLTEERIKTIKKLIDSPNPNA